MIARVARRLKRRRMATDERGVALTEFALLLPILLLMFLGAYEYSDAIGCSRKVTVTARAVADLTSQYSIMSASEVDTVLAASTQIMAPYPANKATVRVTEVTTDATKKTTVVWSRALPSSARRKPGDVFTLPPAMVLPNSTLILGEVVYAYTPVAKFGSLGPLSLTQSIYMVPRVSSTVTCDDCNS